MLLVAHGCGAGVVEVAGRIVSTMSAATVGMAACTGGWSDAGAWAGTWAARIFASRSCTMDSECLPLSFPDGAVRTASAQASDQSARGNFVNGRSCRSLPACDKGPELAVTSSSSANSSSWCTRLFLMRRRLEQYSWKVSWWSLASPLRLMVATAVATVDDGVLPLPSCRSSLANRAGSSVLSGGSSG